MREKRKVYRLLVGMPEGKRPLGRLRHRWVDNITTLERWDGVMWTGLVWLRIGRVESSCEFGIEPSGFMKC
jgi:hypothetical protein